MGMRELLRRGRRLFTWFMIRRIIASSLAVILFLLSPGYECWADVAKIVPGGQAPLMPAGPAGLAPPAKLTLPPAALPSDPPPPAPPPGVSAPLPAQTPAPGVVAPPQAPRAGSHFPTPKPAAPAASAAPVPDPSARGQADIAGSLGGRTGPVFNGEKHLGEAEDVAGKLGAAPAPLVKAPADLKMPESDEDMAAVFAAKFHVWAAGKFPRYDFSTRDYKAWVLFLRFFTPSMGVFSRNPDNPKTKEMGALEAGARYVYGDRLESEAEWDTFKTELEAQIQQLKPSAPGHGRDKKLAQELSKLSEMEPEAYAADEASPFQIPLAALIPDEKSSELVATATTLRRIEAADRAFAMRDYSLHLGPPGTEKSAIPKLLASKKRIPYLAVTMHPGIGTFELVGGYRPKAVRMADRTDVLRLVAERLAQAESSGDFSEFLKIASLVYSGGLEKMTAAVKNDLLHGSDSAAGRRLMTLAHGLAFGASSLTWQDGYLTYAIKRDIWICFEELNAAPTETLEFLNDFLNSEARELVITQRLGHPEVIRPRPGGRFMLWGTMNPETDSNREVLAKTLKSRWRVKYFGDLPADEQRDIVLKLYNMPSVWAEALVKNVHQELVRQARGRLIGERWRDGYEINLRHLMRIGRRWRHFVDQETKEGRPPDEARQRFLLGREAYSVYAGMMRLDAEKNGVWTKLDQAFNLSAIGYKSAEQLRVRPEKIEDLGERIRIGDVELKKGPGGLFVPKPDSDYLVDAAVYARLYEYAKALALGEALLLMGDFAAGKTSDLRYLFYRLNMNLRYKNLDSSTAIEELTGGYVPGQRRGEYVFQEGLLPAAMEERSGVFIDEFNLNPVVEWLNTVRDDGRLYLPHRIVDGWPLMAAAANPPSEDYPGRILISPATRSRYTEFWVSRDESEGRLTALMKHWLKGGTIYAFLLAPLVGAFLQAFAGHPPGLGALPRTAPKNSQSSANHTRTFLFSSVLSRLNIFSVYYSSAVQPPSIIQPIPGRSRGEFRLPWSGLQIQKGVLVSGVLLVGAGILTSHLVFFVLWGWGFGLSGLILGSGWYARKPLYPPNRAILSQRAAALAAQRSDLAQNIVKTASWNTEIRSIAMVALRNLVPPQDADLIKYLEDLAVAETSDLNINMITLAIALAGGPHAEAALVALQSRLLPRHKSDLDISLSILRSRRSVDDSAAEKAKDLAAAEQIPAAAASNLEARTQERLVRLGASWIDELRSEALHEALQKLLAARQAGDPDGEKLAAQRLEKLLDESAAAGQGALPLNQGGWAATILEGVGSFFKKTSAAVQPFPGWSRGDFSIAMDFFGIISIPTVLACFLSTAILGDRHMPWSLAPMLSCFPIVGLFCLWFLGAPFHPANRKILAPRAEALALARPALAQALRDTVSWRSNKRRQALQALADSVPASDSELIDYLADLAIAETSDFHVQTAVLAIGRAGGTHAEEVLKTLQGRLLPRHAPDIEEGLQLARAHAQEAAEQMPTAPRVVAPDLQTRVGARLSRLDGSFMGTLRADTLREALKDLRVARQAGNLDGARIAAQRLEKLLDESAASGQGALPPRPSLGASKFFESIRAVFAKAPSAVQPFPGWSRGDMDVSTESFRWFNTIFLLPSLLLAYLGVISDLGICLGYLGVLFSGLAWFIPMPLHPANARILAARAEALAVLRPALAPAIRDTASRSREKRQAGLKALKKLADSSYSFDSDLLDYLADMAVAETMEIHIDQIVSIIGEAGGPHAQDVLKALQDRLLPRHMMVIGPALIMAARVRAPEAAEEMPTPMAAPAADLEGRVEVRLSRLDGSFMGTLRADTLKEALKDLRVARQAGNQDGERIAAQRLEKLLDESAAVGLGLLPWSKIPSTVQPIPYWSRGELYVDKAYRWQLASFILAVCVSTTFLVRHVSPYFIFEALSVWFGSIIVAPWFDKFPLHPINQKLLSSRASALAVSRTVLAQTILDTVSPDKRSEALEKLTDPGLSLDSELIDYLADLAVASTNDWQIHQAILAIAHAGGPHAQEVIGALQGRLLPWHASLIEQGLKVAREHMFEAVEAVPTADLAARVEVRLSRLGGSFMGTLRADALKEALKDLLAARQAGNLDGERIAAQRLEKLLDESAAVGANALGSGLFDRLRSLFRSKKKAESEAEEDSETAAPPTIEGIFDERKTPEADRPALRAKVERIQTLMKMVGSGVGRDTTTKWVPGDLWAHWPQSNTTTYPLEHLITHSEEELVGLIDHESLHRESTVLDQRLPLVRKYFEDPMKQFLWNAIEDPRVNSRGIHRLPGSQRYLHALYDRYMPTQDAAVKVDPAAEAPDLSQPTGDGGTAFNPKMLQFPHIEFLIATNTYWRQGVKPKFVNKSAEEAFDKARPELDRIFQTYPKEAEPSRAQSAAASLEALKAIDEKIRPLYEPLIAESQKKMAKMGKSKQGKGKGGGIPNMPSPPDQKPPKQGPKKDGQGKPDQNKQKKDQGNDEKSSSEDLKEALDKLQDHARRAAEELGSHIKDNPTKGDVKRAKDDPQASKKPAGQAGNAAPTPLSLEDVANTRREQILNRQATPYQNAYLPVAHLASSMVSHLANVFLKNSRPKDVGYFRTGKKVDLKRAMQREGEGGVRDDVMLRRTQATKRRYKVTLLIDESGSMDNFRREAIQSTVLLVDALARLQIDVEVIGFAEQAVIHHEFSTPLTPQAKDHLMAELMEHLGHGGTHDANAVKLALERILRQDAEGRYIFVVTDGNGNGPSKLADVLPQAEKAGVRVIGVGVGPGMEYVKTAYPRYVAVPNIEDLPRELRDRLMEAIGRVELAARGPAQRFVGFGPVPGLGALPAVGRWYSFLSWLDRNVAWICWSVAPVWTWAAFWGDPVLTGSLRQGVSWKLVALTVVIGIGFSEMASCLVKKFLASYEHHQEAEEARQTYGALPAAQAVDLEARVAHVLSFLGTDIASNMRRPAITEALAEYRAAKASGSLELPLVERRLKSLLDDAPASGSAALGASLKSLSTILLRFKPFLSSLSSWEALGMVGLGAFIAAQISLAGMFLGLPAYGLWLVVGIATMALAWNWRDGSFPPLALFMIGSLPVLSISSISHFGSWLLPVVSVFPVAFSIALALNIRRGKAQLLPYAVGIRLARSAPMIDPSTAGSRALTSYVQGLQGQAGVRWETLKKIAADAPLWAGEDVVNQLFPMFEVLVKEDPFLAIRKAVVQALAAYFPRPAARNALIQIAQLQIDRETWKEAATVLQADVARRKAEAAQAERQAAQAQAQINGLESHAERVLASLGTGIVSNMRRSAITEALAEYRAAKASGANDLALIERRLKSLLDDAPASGSAAMGLPTIGLRLKALVAPAGRWEVFGVLGLAAFIAIEFGLAATGLHAALGAAYVLWLAVGLSWMGLALNRYLVLGRSWPLFLLFITSVIPAYFFKVATSPAEAWTIPWWASLFTAPGVALVLHLRRAAARLLPYLLGVRLAWRAPTFGPPVGSYQSLERYVEGLQGVRDVRLETLERMISDAPLWKNSSEIGKIFPMLELLVEHDPDGQGKAEALLTLTVYFSNPEAREVLGRLKKSKDFSVSQAAYSASLAGLMRSSEEDLQQAQSGEVAKASTGEDLESRAEHVLASLGTDIASNMRRPAITEALAEYRAAKASGANDLPLIERRLKSLLADAPASGSAAISWPHPIWAAIWGLAYAWVGAVMAGVTFFGKMAPASLQPFSVAVMLASVFGFGLLNHWIPEAGAVGFITFLGAMTAGLGLSWPVLAVVGLFLPLPYICKTYGLVMERWAPLPGALRENLRSVLPAQLVGDGWLGLKSARQKALNALDFSPLGPYEEALKSLSAEDPSPELREKAAALLFDLRKRHQEELRRETHGVQATDVVDLEPRAERVQASLGADIAGNMRRSAITEALAQYRAAKASNSNELPIIEKRLKSLLEDAPAAGSAAMGQGRPFSARLIRALEQRLWRPKPVAAAVVLSINSTLFGLAHAFPAFFLRAGLFLFLGSIIAYMSKKGRVTASGVFVGISAVLAIVAIQPGASLVLFGFMYVLINAAYWPFFVDKADDFRPWFGLLPLQVEKGMRAALRGSTLDPVQAQWAKDLASRRPRQLEALDEMRRDRVRARAMEPALRVLWNAADFQISDALIDMISRWGDAEALKTLEWMSQQVDADTRQPTSGARAAEAAADNLRALLAEEVETEQLAKPETVAALEAQAERVLTSLGKDIASRMRRDALTEVLAEYRAAKASGTDDLAMIERRLKSLLDDAPASGSSAMGQGRPFLAGLIRALERRLWRPEIILSAVVLALNAGAFALAHAVPILASCAPLIFCACLVWAKSSKRSVATLSVFASFSMWVAAGGMQQKLPWFAGYLAMNFLYLTVVLRIADTFRPMFGLLETNVEKEMAEAARGQKLDAVQAGWAQDLPGRSVRRFESLAEMRRDPARARPLEPVLRVLWNAAGDSQTIDALIEIVSRWGDAQALKTLEWMANRTDLESHQLRPGARAAKAAADELRPLLAEMSEADEIARKDAASRTPDAHAALAADARRVLEALKDMLGISEHLRADAISEALRDFEAAASPDEKEMGARRLRSLLDLGGSAGLGASGPSFWNLPAGVRTLSGRFSLPWKDRLRLLLMWETLSITLCQSSWASFIFLAGASSWKTAAYICGAALISGMVWLMAQIILKSKQRLKIGPNDELHAAAFDAWSRLSPATRTLVEPRLRALRLKERVDHPFLYLVYPDAAVRHEAQAAAQEAMDRDPAVMAPFLMKSLLGVPWRGKTDFRALGLCGSAGAHELLALIDNPAFSREQDEIADAFALAFSFHADPKDSFSQEDLKKIREILEAHAVHGQLQEIFELIVSRSVVDPPARDVVASQAQARIAALDDSWVSKLLKKALIEAIADMRASRASGRLDDESLALRRLESLLKDGPSGGLHAVSARSRASQINALASASLGSAALAAVLSLGLTIAALWALAPAVAVAAGGTAAVLGLRFIALPVPMAPIALGGEVTAGPRFADAAPVEFRPVIETVQRLSARLGLSPAQVPSAALFIPNDPSYDAGGWNARAVGEGLSAGSAIAVGRSWLGASASELEGVVAHELGHLFYGDNRRDEVHRELMKRLGRLAGIFALDSVIAVWSLGAAWTCQLSIPAFWLFASFLALAFSRAQESRADRFSAELAGPEAAKAFLTRLAHAAPGAGGLFSDHPSMPERLRSIQP